MPGRRVARRGNKKTIWFFLGEKKKNLYEKNGKTGGKHLNLKNKRL